MFSGGIEMEHWANIGSVCLLLMEKKYLEVETDNIYVIRKNYKK